MASPKSCSSTRRIAIEVNRIAGCALGVWVRVLLGPVEMVCCRPGQVASRISSSGARVRGKALMRGVSMPGFWVPWPAVVVSQLMCGIGRGGVPGKKRAVLERCETVASVERRARQRALARGLERRGRSCGKCRAFMAGIVGEGEGEGEEEERKKTSAAR